MVWCEGVRANPGPPGEGMLAQPEMAVNCAALLYRSLLNLGHC